ncbi:hypothetical protein [Streptomyces sp. NPDC056192]|uniref:hypothetical protein n=1 Tax=Streptomyces sp. NPDC056192 TaxID=3345743 RepID=UPI0035DAF60A
MTDTSRFDRDPEALAWARAKIQHEIDRCEDFHRSATAAGKAEQGEMWRRLGNRMKRVFIGGEDCTIAAFDERLPELAHAIDKAIPAPIDRAVRRDHSLCSVKPCSDCR